MTDDLAAIARECGGIRSGSFDAVKQWTFTEDGLAEFVRRTLPAGVAASPGQMQDKLIAALSRAVFLYENSALLAQPLKDDPLAAGRWVGEARAALNAVNGLSVSTEGGSK